MESSHYGRLQKPLSIKETEKPLIYGMDSLHFSCPLQYTTVFSIPYFTSLLFYAMPTQKTISSLLYLYCCKYTRIKTTSFVLLRIIYYLFSISCGKFKCLNESACLSCKQFDQTIFDFISQVITESILTKDSITTNKQF